MRLFFFTFWGLLFPIIVEKLLLIISTLNTLFKLLKQSNGLYVNPLHPDNAGGLGALGEISLGLNYTAGISLLFIIGLYISHGLTYPLLLGTFVTFIILGVSFFLPLHKAHKAMNHEKKTLLVSLSRNYEHINKLLVKKLLSTDNPKDIFDNQGNELYNTHEKLTDIYQHIRKLPTWPYDMPTLVKFCGTMFIPFLMFSVDMITNTDSILWKILQEIFPNIFTLIQNWFS